MFRNCCGPRDLNLRLPHLKTNLWQVLHNLSLVKSVRQTSSHQAVAITLNIATIDVGSPCPNLHRENRNPAHRFAGHVGVTADNPVRIDSGRTTVHSSVCQKYIEKPVMAQMRG